MQLVTEAEKYRFVSPFDVETEIEHSDAPRIQKWTKAEYYRLSEMGFLNGKRTELIDGEIIVKYYNQSKSTGKILMSAMSSAHFTAANLAGDVIRKIFQQDFIVSIQCPLDFGENSEPEPDVAVITGNPRDFKNALPKTAALIVEVAESSLTYDRGDKAISYARFC